MTRRVSTIKKEWSGARVCSDCFDPKPADLKAPRVRPEGVPVHNASPETDPVFHKYTDASHL
jgi:hypothetical protein